MRNAKLIANLCWLPAIAVALLQMYRVNAGILTSYGADFFGPIALYASMRTNGTIFQRFLRRTPSPVLSAAIVILGCVAWECCQRFDLTHTPLAITRGSFDPLDIVAYIAGAGVAFAVERLSLRS